MSDLCQQADLFDPAPPDENTEMTALVRSLRLSQGFSLLFARSNQVNQRRCLIAALRKELPQLRIQEIVFDKPIRHLLDELRTRIEEPTPDAIFVSGLEQTLPVAAKAHATPLVANLNASRNSFSVYLSCPLVLWAPDYIITAIMRGAPDFFSVRSGIYYFSRDTKQLSEALEVLNADELPVENLPLEDKLRRIQTIEGLLAEYRALPAEHNNDASVVSLLDQRANLYLSLNHWREAEADLFELLKIVRAKHYRFDEANILTNLGIVYKRQERWAEAADKYRQSLELFRELHDTAGEAEALYDYASILVQREQWTEAETAYGQCLDAARQMGNDRQATKTLNKLGLVYTRQGRYPEAETAIEDSLARSRRQRDRYDEEQALANLANLCHRMEQWEKGEILYQQALSIARELGDSSNLASIQNNLGTLYFRTGRLSEARKVLREALDIRRELGDKLGEGWAMQNLAQVYIGQGLVAEGMQMQKSAINLLEETEDEKEIERARELLAEMETMQTTTA